MVLVGNAGFVALIPAVGPQIAYAAFNAQINYQGKLTTGTNVAVPNGTYHMKFWLLTSPTAATTTAIWTEDRSTVVGNRVTVTNGLFSLMLGSSTPLTTVDFNQTLYLGVEVGGSAGSPVWDGEMSPRKVLGAVPAAFEADKLDGLSSERFFRNDITNSTSSATTSLSVAQNGAGKVAEFFGGGYSAFSILSNGNVGVGTTSPYAKLSVAGDVVAGRFVATSTVASVFPYASSTSITVSGNTYLFNSSIQGYNSGGGSNDAIKVVSTNLGAGFGVQNTNASGFSGVEYIDNGGNVAVFTGYNNGNPGEFRFNNIAAGGFIAFKISGTDQIRINNTGTITMSSLGGSGTAIVMTDNSGNLSAAASLGVANGGTGATSFGQGWIYSAGGTGALAASTSPTVNYITATSTATSTFAGGIRTNLLNVTSTTASSTFANGIAISDGCFSVNGTCLTSSSGTIGSGTAGQFPYYAGSGSTLTATSSLFLSASGNIGIGSTTPNKDLVISRADTPTIRLSQTGEIYTTQVWDVAGNDAGFFVRDANSVTLPFRINPGAPSSSVHIGSDGMVGVGVGGPTYKLDVAGNGHFTSLVDASHFVATSSATSTFVGGLSVKALNVTSATASSTFANGINLSAGCFAVNGSCLPTSSGVISSISQTYGSAQTGAITLATSSATSFNGLTISNSITNSGGTFTFAPNTITGTLGVAGGGTGATSYGQGWVYSTGGTTALAASTSPTINYLTATSTTGTNYFAGNVGIGTTTASTKVSINGAGNSSATNALAIRNSDYQNLMTVRNDGLVEGYNSSNQLSYRLSAISGSPGGFSTRGGKFTIGVIDAGFSSGIQFAANSSSGRTFIDGWEDVVGSGYDLILGASDRSNSKIGIGIDTTVGASAKLHVQTPAGVIGSIFQGSAAQTADLMQWRNSGNTVLATVNKDGWFGIGTSSPYSMLSVAGQVVAQNYVATSTTATSTFAYDVASTGRLSVLQTGTNATIIGNTTGNARGSGAIDVQSVRSLATQVASGANSIAFGQGNTASVSTAIALGYTNSATGIGASAVGYGNLASGADAAAYGGGNTASQSQASAFGFANNATAANSVAFGYITTASASGASAFGSNITNNIANSTQIGPSDAAKLTILSSGNVGIGTTSPYAKLSVGGEVVGSYFTATTSTATSTFAGGIQTNLLNVTSATASSTFANGINVANGCFAINGTCLTQGLTSAITSIGPAGSLQTGPAVTFATSSSAFNGLTASTTITATGNTITFANTLAGRLGVAGGGTGAATLTGILQGNGTNAFTAITDSSTVGQTLRVTGASTYGWGALDLANSNAVTGTLSVSNGGTGAASYGQGWIYSTGGTTALAASTSPTVRSITATSSTASIFTALRGLSNNTQLAVDLSNRALVDASGGTSVDWANRALVFGGFDVLTWDSGDANDSGGNASINWYSRTLNDQSSNPFIYWANGNLGVGTSTPFAKLAVSTATQQSGTLPLFAVASTTKATLFNVLGNGNVGIGTTTPGSLLSLGNTGNSTINLDPTATSTFGLGINLRGGCFAIAGTCLGSSSGTVNSGTTGQFPYYAANGTALTATSTIFVSTASNVGIGTNSPTSNLTVYQSAGTGASKGITFAGNSLSGVSSGTGFLFSLGYNATNNKQIWFGDPDGAGNASFNFARMVIGGAGSLATIDAVTGDGTARSKLMLGVAGDSNSGVYVGTVLGVNGNAAIGSSYYNQTPPANGLIVEGRVGVGTTSPWAALSVSTSTQQSGTIPLFAVASTTKATLFNVLGNGNVGVGSTSPYAALSVHRATASVGDGRDLVGVASYVSNAGDGVNKIAGRFYASGNATADTIYGVYAEGVGTGDPNNVIGVYGTTASNGIGVYGTGGTGVYGSANGSNTTSIYANQGNASGYAIQSFGGKNYFQNSTGIGSTTPFANLSVQGSVTQSATSSLFSVASSTKATLFNIISNGNVGIGTTTPGSLLSLGNTGNSTINLDPTATSTFGLGINLRGGCFAIAGTCLGSSSGTVNSGTTGQFPYYAGAGTTLTATSTLFVAASSTIGVGTTTGLTARLNIDGSVRIAERGTDAIIIGNTTGNTRGAYALDIQSQRQFATNVASGMWSTAYGHHNTVSGSVSIGVGYANTTSGAQSIAFGQSNNTTADFGVGIGYGNTVGGTSGTAVGIQNSAGQSASVFGYNNDASGNTSVAVGATNSVDGDSSVAFGIGNDISSSIASAGAFGFSNQVTTSDALAFGNGIVNSIGSSLMIGVSDTAKTTMTGDGWGALVGINDLASNSRLSVNGKYLSSPGDSSYARILQDYDADSDSFDFTTYSPFNDQVARWYMNHVDGFTAQSYSPGSTLALGQEFILNENAGYSELRTETNVLRVYPNNAYVSNGFTVGITSSGSALASSNNLAVGGSFGVLTAPTHGAIIQGNTGIATSTPWGRLSVSSLSQQSGTIPLLVVASTTKATLFNVLGNGNVGIGTTTPGSLLSLGNTGNSTINLDPTATSTFGLGINLRGGCFAVNGTCVGSGSGSGTVNSGTTGQFPYYAGAGTTLTATSSLFLATTGFVGIGNTSPSTALHVIGNGAGSTYQATYENTTSNGTAGFALKNSGWEIRFRTAPNAGWFEITDNSNGVQHRWNAKDYLLASDGAFGFSSETNFATNGVSARDSSISRLAAGKLGIGTATAGTSDGTLVAGSIGVGTTTPFSRLSVSTIAQQSGTLPLFTVASTTKATLFNVLGNGNVGVGTTTPGSILSLGSTGNSTINLDASATSTFGAGINLRSGCFAIAGTCVGGSGGSGTVGSGTTGQFPYYAGAGTTLTATSSLFVSSASYVGISSTSPTTALGVGGQILTSDSITVNSSVDGAGLYAVSSGATAGAALGVKSTAGTGNEWLFAATGPSNGAAYSFLFYNSTNTYSMLRLEGAAASRRAIFNGTTGIAWDNGSSQFMSGTVDTSLSRGAAGKVYVGTGTNGSAAGTLIAASIGVGTTSPYAALSVHGQGVFTQDVRANYFTATSTTATSTFAGFIDVNGTGTNSTSTFASNLWVKGGLKIGTSSLYLDNNGIYASGGGFNLRAGSATSTIPQLSVGTTTATTTAKLFVDGALGITASSGAVIIGNTFGNTRGNNAVDIQSGRGVFSQVASGLNSVAVGHSNYAEQYAVSIGYLNATNSGGFSTSIGYNNITNGTGNAAVGYQNTAYSGQSSAFGYANQATATFSTAIGSSNQAGSSYATAVGYSNQAWGAAGVAIGFGNYAGGYDNVVSIGNDNQVISGEANLAFGRSNYIETNNGFGGVFGTSNSIISTASGSDNSFAFGYGNIITSQSSGGNSAYGINNNVSYTNGAEDSIAFGKDLILNTVQTVAIGYSDSTKLSLDRNSGWFGTGLVGTTGTGSLCYDNNNGAIILNDFSDSCTSSTRATKHDIADLNINGLEAIKALKPVSFVYNNGNGRVNYGFIAEDSAAVRDPFGTYNANGELTGVDTRAFVSVTIKAIQEIAQRISMAEAPTTTPSLTINSNGNVGFGIEDAAYKLQAKGDVAGYGFVVEAHRDQVSNIHEVEEEDLVAYTEKIKDIDLSTFTFEGDTGTSTRLGILSNDAPSEILTQSGDVDMYKLSVFTLGAVKAQQLRLDSLEERLATVEAQVLAGNGGGGLWAGPMDAFENFGISISETVAKFKNVMVAGLTVGTSEKPTGITLYDEVTGYAYCVKIVNSKLKNFAGACDENSDEEIPDDDDEQPTGTSTPPIVDTGTTTPPVVDNSSDDGSTPDVTLDTPDVPSIDNGPVTSNVGNDATDVSADDDAGDSDDSSSSGDAGSSSNGDGGSNQP